ncbi:hypothetical protein PoB_001059000 [Plakobranchus ocellatus]|uniref:Uncharacterized protein n=1 Tax=Plakobranchus ocellatus TaxID=259542 RepID=A0AAV3YNN7_9GAST|nr:hypothetical protein PoB_001059000 [Plakobranchus ocellatus]
MVLSSRIDFNSLWILKGEMDLLSATFADPFELITICLFKCAVLPSREKELAKEACWEVTATIAGPSPPQPPGSTPPPIRVAPHGKQGAQTVEMGLLFPTLEGHGDNLPRSPLTTSGKNGGAQSFPGPPHGKGVGGEAIVR